MGLARARAMALVQLALPGAVYLYNGDELGLPDVELPDDARRDAVWKHAEHGRDGCRVPQPWEADLPAYGFTTGTPWLPIPDSYAALSAAAQLEDTGSTLSLYRRALELRRMHPGFTGLRASSGSARPPGCLAFRRVGTTLVCALNTSTGAGAAAAGRPAAGQRPARRGPAAPGHGRLAGLTTDTGPALFLATFPHFSSTG